MLISYKNHVSGNFGHDWGWLWQILAQWRWPSSLPWPRNGTRREKLSVRQSKNPEVEPARESFRAVSWNLLIQQAGQTFNSHAGGVRYCQRWLENKIILVSSNFHALILIPKMGVKMNFRIITKNHEADPEIGFLKKSIPKPYARATAMPPAWELILRFFIL